MTENPPHSLPPPHVGYDYREFVHHLDGMNLTEAEQIELLNTLWTLMCDFVALGFEIHPVQHAEKACGKVRKPSVSHPLEDAGVL